MQAEARYAKLASDRDAQEAAQSKADGAMNGVVQVQDRLVRALQAELDMTNRAREATQVQQGGAEDEGTTRTFPFICVRLSQASMHLGESVSTATIRTQCNVYLVWSMYVYLYL